MWLGADAEDEVPLHADSGAMVEIIGRPLDLALAFVQSNERALDGKIVELFWVDAGEFSGDELFAQVAGRRGRRSSRIAPAREGKDQHRVSQRGAALEVQRIHVHLIYHK